MRKLAMLFLVAMMLTIGSVSVSVAYAEPAEAYFDDDFGFMFLNPQPLPP